MPAPPTRQRSISIGTGQAPALRRTSTDGGRPRPVPFARNFDRVHPATTGVAVLEQMEHIDRVEAKLQRAPHDVPEESDVGVAVAPRPIPGALSMPSTPRSAPLPAPTSPRSPNPLPAVQELVQLEDAEEGEEDEDEDEDAGDLAALSKSMPHLDEAPASMHARWTSAGDGVGASHPFDIFTPDGERKIGIVERLEPVAAQPLFSWFSSF
jgi:phosphatidylinositol 4-kinase type 2